MLRMALVTLCATVVAFFAYLLFQPFSNPDVYFAVVEVGHRPADALEGDGPLYARADRDALAAFGRDLQSYRPEAPSARLSGIETPGDVASLKLKLRKLAPESNSVLLLSMTVRGFTENGAAYIRWPAASADAPPQAARVDDLLEAVRSHPAPVKALLVDVRPDPQTASTTLLNDFPSRLQQAVERTGDRSLWVLISHSTLERSHLNHARRRSVFSHFVELGLSGKADLDDDGAISIAEFGRYVANRVSFAAQLRTGMRESQTPVLCWGGGIPQLRNTPQLLPVRTTAGETGETSERAELFPETLVVGEVQESAGIPGATPNPADPLRAPDLKPAPETPVAKPAPAKQQPKAEPAKKSAVGQAFKPAGEDRNVRPTMAPPAGETPRSIPEKLVLAWLWKDVVTQRSADGSSNVVDDAPDLLAALDGRLAACERAYRTSGPFLPPNKDQPPGRRLRALHGALDELVRLYRALNSRRLKLSPAASDLEKRVAAFLNGPKLPDGAVCSLALAERRARLTGAAPPERVRRLTQDFDALLAGGSRDELRVFLAKFPADAQYTELHLARRLSEDSPASWDAIRRALRVRRYAERVGAASGGFARWLAPAIDRADGLRLTAERRLLDGIGADYEADARHRLVEATAAYSEAVEQLRMLRAAVQLHNELLYELPGLTAWARAMAPLSDDGTRRLKRVATIARLLDELGDRLEAPGQGGGVGARESGSEKEPRDLQNRRGERLRDPNSLPESATNGRPKSQGSAHHHSPLTTDHSSPTRIRRLAARLRIERLALQQRVREQVVRPARAVLRGGDPVPGDGRRFEAGLWLHVDAESRLTLLRAIETVARQSPAASSDVSADPLSPPQRSMTSADARRLIAEAGLLTRLAELAATQEPGFSSDHGPSSSHRNSSGGAAAEKSRASSHDLLQTWRRRSSAGLAPNTRLIDSLQSALRSARRRSLHEVRTAFRPTRSGGKGSGVSGQITTHHAPLPLARLIRAWRALGAPLPQRDAGRPTAWQRRATWTDTIALQHQRLIRALTDAPEADAAFLERSSRGCASLLAARGIEAAAPAQTVRVGTPARVSLVDVTAQEATVRVTTTVAGTQPARLFLEYDPQIVDVQAANGWPLSKSTDVEWLRGAKQRVNAAAEFTLSPGEPFILPLKIGRKVASRARPCRIVLHAAAANRVSRRLITVPLPRSRAVELIARSAENVGRLVSTKSSGVELHPFPNRDTGFRFALRNLTGVKRTVNVRFHAVARPPVEDVSGPPVGADQVDRVLRLIQAGRAIAEQADVELPADGSPVDLSPKSASPKPQPGTTPVSLAHGVIVAIRDKQSQLTSLRYIAVAPQRPRRFLRMGVQSDWRRKRVSVRVSAASPQWLPADGVKIRCDFAGSKTAQPSLQGELKRDKPELVLSGRVPDTVASTVMLQVHVDEFPRAFLFPLAADRTPVDVPELRSRAAVRISAPKGGTAFGGKQQAVAIQFSVDAPVGSFVDGRDSVEIGIDTNRDRVLDGEPVLRFHSDRQVTVQFQGVSEDGVLTLNTQVRDFRVDLPAKSVSNLRANVIGRLHASGGTWWSRPVAVVFDSRPPVIAPLRVLRIPAGEDAKVVVRADDEGLSGVSRVEFFVDEAHSGKFPKEGAISAGANSVGEWSATLATQKLAAGAYPLLVRATDAAGNVSDVAETEVIVLSKEDVQRAQAVRVAGFVTFGKEPVADAEIRLLDARAVASQPPNGKPPKPVVPAVTSNAKGEFAFPEVPPGKYVVVAFRRALANRNRKASVPVEVTAGKTPDAVQIRLR